MYLLGYVLLAWLVLFFVNPFDVSSECRKC